jgi:hypothetical protein
MPTPPDGNEYVDTAVGMDGLFYGVEGPLTTGGSILDVYDPQSQKFVRSEPTPNTCDAVTADTQGRAFVVGSTQDTEIFELQRDGTVLRSVATDLVFIGSIEMTSDNQLLVATGDGKRELFDTNLKKIGMVPPTRQFVEQTPSPNEPYIDISGFSTYVATGIARNVTVSVEDHDGNLLPGYRGTIRLSSSDPAAALPSDYTFVGADAGTHQFTASFNTPGLQTLTATDLNSRETYDQSGITVHFMNDGTIPITDPVGMVPDPSRNLLYITNGGPLIERYDLTTQTLLSPFKVGLNLGVGDITPDGQFLVVPDQGKPIVHKFNLDTGVDTPISFSPGFEEFGYQVSVVSNNLAFFTTGGLTWVTFRQIDLATNTISVRTGPMDFNNAIAAHSELIRSADRSMLMLTQGANSGAETSMYDPASDTFPINQSLQTSTTGGSPPSASPDGNLIAFGAGPRIVDRNLNLVTELSAGNGGTAFDPVRHLLYVADFHSGNILAYDTTTWQVEFSLIVAGGVHARLWDPPTIMTVSPDGNWLFYVTSTFDGVSATGVQPIRIGHRLSFSAAPAYVFAGSSYSLTLTDLDALGNVDLAYRGTVHFLSTDPTALLPKDFTFTEASAGTSLFTFTPFSTGTIVIVASDGTDQAAWSHIVVHDVAPILTPPLVTSTTEGSSSISLGSFVDTGGNDSPFNVYVDWGDSSYSTWDVAAPSASLSAMHTYADNGLRGVWLTVSDAHNFQSTMLIRLNVVNVAPKGKFVAAPSAIGNAASIGFTSSTDPSAADTASGFLYSYDFNNDGVFDVIETHSASVLVPAAYLTALGPHPVKGRIEDKDFGFTDYTATINVLALPSVSGAVFGDTNLDSQLEPGEARVPNQTVFLDANGNQNLDAGELSTQTNSLGAYTFAAVPPGTYAVCLKLPSGWHQTDSMSSVAFTLGPGLQLSNMDLSVQGPPVANLGGPYSAAEGASINLSGSASSEVGGTIAKYEWDTNYNGTTFVARATGVNASFSAVGLDGPSSRAIALRVTDGNGITAIATASVTINNAPPKATFAAGGTVTLGAAGSVSFSGQTDPSPADVTAGFKYSYDFDNNNTFETANSTSATTSVPASYLSTAGSHTIHGRIIDKDGGFTDYTTTIQVNAASGGASISGTIYNDANGNGVRDSGEAVVSGQKLFIDKNVNSILDAGEPTFTTGTAGTFTFSGLAAGTYRVREVAMSGWRWTNPSSGYYNVTVTTGQSVTGKNFGETTNALISGIIFKDTNANAKQDTGEAALSGWVVYLDTNNNGKLDAGELSFTTGTDGKFSFVVPAGTYHLREVLKSGFAITTPAGGLYTLTLSSGQSMTGKNFGVK